MDAPFVGGEVLLRGAPEPVVSNSARLILEGLGEGAWRVVTGYVMP